MKAVLVLFVSIVGLQVKAWSTLKGPLEYMRAPAEVHHITDCMQVSSEEGNFIFKKSSSEIDSNNLPHTTPVCGLYIVSDPDKTIQMTIKHLDVSCESGGLLSFVDGWELNAKFFPGIKDHPFTLENRIEDFCNEHDHWLRKPSKKFFKSQQNAALLQYRIPDRGSFIVNVRFEENRKPCNILADNKAAVYTLTTDNIRRNCTLTAIFPAIVSIVGINVGPARTIERVDYECSADDRLEIGGSSNLETFGMEKSSNVCGHTNTQGPKQAIFCDVTSVRLVSSGLYNNEASIFLRQADENDLSLATVICPL